MFDFTNETFSSFISIFSAVIGLGYPVLLQSIQRIDEQYKSTQLSKRFQKEYTFLIFQIILFVNIIISIIIPFLLYLTVGCISSYIILLQAIGVALLLLTSFHLFRIITVYYHPKTLGDRFNKIVNKKIKAAKTIKDLENKNITSELLNIIEIAKYGSLNKDYDTYFTCFSIISNYLFAYQSMTKKDEPVIYKGKLLDILEKIQQYSIDKKNIFFYNHNEIIHILFNTLYKRTIAEQTYNYVWSLLNSIIIKGNKEWFQQYWSCCDQYYTSSFPRHIISINDTNINASKNAERFYEFNFMVGVLLVYNKRYNWLKEIMYFTNSIPASYVLIPGSFSKIFNLLKHFNLLRKSYLLNPIEQRYTFSGMNKDVNVGYYIENEIIKYLAILFIRMFSFDDFNIQHCEPLDLPNSGTDIQENEYIISLNDKLKEKILYWYDQSEVQSILFEGEMQSKEVVIDLINQYQESCQSKIEEIYHTPTIDPEKAEKLKDTLHRLELENQKKIILQENVLTTTSIQDYLTNGSKKELVLPYRYKLPENEILQGYTSYSVNLEETIIEHLYETIQRYYLSYLLSQTSKRYYKILFDDIFEAIDKLKINENYVIIALGIDLTNHRYFGDNTKGLSITSDNCEYKKITIFRSFSPSPCIIIAERKDLPFFEFRMNKEEHLTTITNDSHLYSNISDELNVNDRILELKYYINFYYKNEFRFIKLDISYDLPPNNKGDINEIVPYNLS